MAASTEVHAADFDVAIVGAGGAGGVLSACLTRPGALAALAGTPATASNALPARPLKVALIEQSPPRPVDPEVPDQRGLVLTLGSIALLEAAGLWPHLADAATDVTRVHISRQHTFGTLQISADEFGLDALARVVQGNRLHHALDTHLAALAESGALTLFRPCRVLRRAVEGQRTRLDIAGDAGEFCLHADLVVAADGTDSPLAEAAGLPVTRYDYQQTALVAVLAAHPHHEGTALERFTCAGPVALLPIPDGRRVCVLVLETETAASVLAGGAGAYLACVRDALGPRLAGLELRSPIRPWPLQRVLRDSFGAAGLALIGNAAHTVHPNGAQGLNLGLADVRELAGRIASASAARRPLGSEDFIVGYRRARRRDQRAVTLGSHAVARFTRWSGVLGAGAYHAGFGLVDWLPALKRSFVWRATGLHGQAT